MYSNSTIAKYHEKAEMLYQMYKGMPLEKVKVCESVGNRKIGNTINYSLAPILSCGGNCRVCIHKCYDIKACMQYDAVMKARVRNYYLATEHLNYYFFQIDSSLSRKRTLKPVRFHVGGDIISLEYLDQMVKLARKHSKRKFWSYTKQYDIVNTWMEQNGPLPENLVIMYSVWDGLECVNPYNQPTFECVLKGHDAPKGKYHCNGNCQYCIEHNCGCVAGMSSYVDEH